MRLLQIRDVPEHIYRRIEEEAAQQRRSLAQQSVAILARGLRAELDPKSRRRRILQEARETGKTRKEKLSDPAKLIRKDRSR